MISVPQTTEQVEIEPMPLVPVISNNLLGIQPHGDATTKMENFETFSLTDGTIQSALRNIAKKSKLQFVSSQNLRSHI